MDRPPLVLLADDFTGACDAAGAFAAARGTLVLLAAPAAWPRPVAPMKSVEVLSIDLDLRERPDAQACEATRAAALRLRQISPTARLFVKIDSTLRGPVRGLVAGASTGSGKEKALAVVAPAFPEQGRLLQNGTVMLDGKPGLSLTTILGQQTTLVLRADLAHSPGALECSIEEARGRGAQHVVVDTDTPACLDNLAVAWTNHPDWLLVGSGGLARHVAEPLVPPRAHQLAARGAVLVVAGSPSPMTRSQIEHLRPLAPFTVVETAASAPPPPPALASELLVLCTPPAAERDAGENARAVAETVLAWSRQLRPGALILAGGATARLVCERLGAGGVCLSGELSPGVPIGRLVGGRWDTVIVVTKAGGFGTPTTLLDAVQALGSAAEFNTEGRS